MIITFFLTIRIQARHPHLGFYGLWSLTVYGFAFLNIREGGNWGDP